MDDKSKNINLKQGFTLIELLVVIVIIGVLSSFGYITFSGYQKSARDTERKSDLNQYKIALENYATNNNSTYIAVDSLSRADTVCGSSLTSYMSQCLDDKDGTHHYYYSGSATQWVLRATLEKTDSYWMVCSNGKSGEMLNSTSISGSTCPLP